MNLGKASLRLLSLMGAAALGSGPTLAFHQRQSSPPQSSLVMLETTDPFQRAPVYEPGALFDKDLKPEVSRPSEAEFAILAKFESTPDKMIEFHATADGTFGYGALRASASCLACHDKPEGTLLGLFRYHFENGPTAWTEDLVSK